MSTRATVGGSSRPPQRATTPTTTAGQQRTLVGIHEAAQTKHLGREQQHDEDRWFRWGCDGLDSGWGCQRLWLVVVRMGDVFGFFYFSWLRIWMIGMLEMALGLEGRMVTLCCFFGWRWWLGWFIVCSSGGARNLCDMYNECLRCSHEWKLEERCTSLSQKFIAFSFLL